MTSAHSTILSEIADVAAEMIEIRQDIHRHPETCYEEFRTSDLVARLLTQRGIRVERGIAGTGLVGTLVGSRDGNRSVGLRADMDALDILEQTGKPYASVIPGKMHACGHDGHTAMLLGAAKHLARTRDFAGTVHFLFQPAEEGQAGGLRMVEEGLFTRFPCDAVYGVHNKPGIAIGDFATRPGPLLAASDSWKVSFHGTGGHGGGGAHVATDPTLPLGHFLLGAHAIIGRNVPASEMAVLSVGHVAAGQPNAFSVIPALAEVIGTARSYTPETRVMLERRLGELATGVAQSYGCTAMLDYYKGYPSLVNDAGRTAVAVRAAQGVSGVARVEAEVTPITASDDFAYMLNERPGAMMWVGNGSNPDGSIHNNHTPLYDFNDEALPYGIAYWVGVAREELAIA